MTNFLRAATSRFISPGDDAPVTSCTFKLSENIRGEHSVFNTFSLHAWCCALLSKTLRETISGISQKTDRPVSTTVSRTDVSFQVSLWLRWQHWRSANDCKKKPAGKWGPSHRAAWCNIALLQTELLQMPEVMNYLPKNNQRTCKRILHSNKKNHLAGTTNSYVKTQPYQSKKACLGCFPASTNLAQSWAFRRCSRSACVTFTQSDSQEERLEELTAPAGRPGSWSKSAAQKAVPVLKLV